MIKKTFAQFVKEIEDRVRPTICPTFSSEKVSLEGRISQVDFDTLVMLAHKSLDKEPSPSSSSTEDN